MTYDKQQVIPKALLGSMILALALGLAACDRPPSGDSVERSFDKSVDDPRRDSNEVAMDADTNVAKEYVRASETVTETDRGVNNIALAARVKAALMGTRSLNATKIDVGANTNGEVTLTGTAEDATTRDVAERVALSVEGVTAVRNAITIARSS